MREQVIVTANRYRQHSHLGDQHGIVLDVASELGWQDSRLDPPRKSLGFDHEQGYYKGRLPPISWRTSQLPGHTFEHADSTAS